MDPLNPTFVGLTFPRSSYPRAPQEGNGVDSGLGGSLRVPTTGMAKIGTQFGGGGGAATLERTGIDLSTATPQLSPKTDDGEGGGNNGNKINNGGGGDGNDNGDDDDYFNKDGDGEVRREKGGGGS